MQIHDFEGLYLAELEEAKARSIAQDTGAQITISEDVAEATLGADFLYTGVWVSMGNPGGTVTRRARQWRDRQQLYRC